MTGSNLALVGHRPSQGGKLAEQPRDDCRVFYVA
jgi:hypothetical protein